MDLTFSDAVGTLRQERSDAESRAALIKRYAPDDVDVRALYAQAKAAFDGLIEQLLADLAQNRDPQLSAVFRERLDAAVVKRRAFGERADMLLKPVVPDGARPAWLDALTGIPADLVKALFDGGIAIWREWRGAGAERRKQIATLLEGQRWKSFASVNAAQ